MDGKFLGPGGSSVPEGQALLSGNLDACFEVAQELKAREALEEVDPMLKPIHERLFEMKEQLERLCKYDHCRHLLLANPHRVAITKPHTAVMTHRWTLRETDLYK